MWMIGFGGMCLKAWIVGFREGMEPGYWVGLVSGFCRTLLIMSEAFLFL